MRRLLWTSFVVAVVSAAAAFWLSQPLAALQRRPSNFAFASHPWFGPVISVPGALLPVPARDDDELLHPFRVALADADLQKIREAVVVGEGMRSTDRGGWTLGVSTSYMDGLLNYWLSNYDWRKVEARINAWPQLKTDIDGLRLHVVHVRGERAHGRPVVPLLLLHGWPGSFYDFHRIIDALADPRDNVTAPVFDVVVPSLAGFVFSEPPARSDLGVYEHAVVMHKLMLRLGYKSYFVHGARIGAAIAQGMAQLYPEAVLGLHMTTMPGGVLALSASAWLQLAVGAIVPDVVLPDHADQSKVYPLGPKLLALLGGVADMILVTLRPDSLAYALAQSPVALTAWLVDKYHAWCDPGHQSFAFDREDMITTAMLHWIAGTGGTSMRIFHSAWLDHTLAEGARSIVTVPVGFVSTHTDVDHHPNFICLSTVASCPRPVEPGETLLQTVPRPWAAQKFTDLVSFTELGNAGRFVELEHPDAVLADLRSFVAAVRSRPT